MGLFAWIYIAKAEVSRPYGETACKQIQDSKVSQDWDEAEGAHASED